MVLNSDLIEHIESTPDTVIALTNGQKFVVLESADEVIEKVIEFRRLISNCSRLGAGNEEPVAGARWGARNSDTA